LIYTVTRFIDFKKRQGISIFSYIHDESGFSNSSMLSTLHEYLYNSCIFAYYLFENPLSSWIELKILIPCRFLKSMNRVTVYINEPCYCVYQWTVLLCISMNRVTVYISEPCYCVTRAGFQTNNMQICKNYTDIHATYWAWSKPCTFYTEDNRGYVHMLWYMNISQVINLISLNSYVDTYFGRYILVGKFTRQWNEYSIFIIYCTTPLNFVSVGWEGQIQSTARPNRLMPSDWNVPWMLHICYRLLVAIYNENGVFVSLPRKFPDQNISTEICVHIVRHVWGQNTHTRAVNKRISLST
jgi:hypothetical protein